MKNECSVAFGSQIRPGIFFLTTLQCFSAQPWLQHRLTHALPLQLLLLGLKHPSTKKSQYLLRSGCCSPVSSLEISLQPKSSEDMASLWESQRRSSFSSGSLGRCTRDMSTRGHLQHQRPGKLASKRCMERQDKHTQDTQRVKKTEIRCYRKNFVPSSPLLFCLQCCQSHTS